MIFELENSYSLPNRGVSIHSGHVSSTARIVLSTNDGAFHVLTTDCALVYNRQDSQNLPVSFESFTHVDGAGKNEEVLVVAQGTSLRMYNFTTGLPYRDSYLAHDRPIMMLKALQPNSVVEISKSLPPIMLASSDLKGEIVLWDIEADGLKRRHTLNGHSAQVKYLSLHPNDRNFLISGSHDGSIRVWNTETGEQTLLCEPEDDEKKSCSFSDSTGKTINYTESVSSMAVIPDGRMIAGGIGGFVRVWDLQTGKLQKSWQAHYNGHPKVGPVLNQILPHPSGKAFITTGTDGKICLWDLNTHQLMRTIKPFEHSVLPKTLAWCGNKLVCAGKDGSPENVCGDFIRVIVWDLDDLELQEGLSESYSELSTSYTMTHEIYVVDTRIVMLVTRKGTGMVEVWKESELENDEQGA